MKCAATHEPPRLPVPPDHLIRMPVGLLGFEHLREYLLLADPAEDPFLWLQVPQDPTLAFLVVSPFPLVPGYQPELHPEDARSLELTSPEDAVVLSIVTVRGPDEATLNLKGPIVINRRTRVARQVIPVNAAEFSVQHPLPVARA